MKLKERFTTCGAAGTSRPGRSLWGGVWLALAASLAVLAAGCGGSAKGSSVVAANPSRLYLAAGVGNLETYAIDHTANTFVVSTYDAYGGTIQASGSACQLSNGILDLDTSYLDGYNLQTPLPTCPPTGNSTSNQVPVTGNNAESSTWAVELPGQAALVELETTNQYGTTTSFAPLVPTQSCPSLATAETFQFVTIPKRLNTKTSLVANGWNPQLETAYGSVKIATSGTSVQFSDVSQSILPVSAANGGTLGNPAPASATAACSPTFFGQVISVPSSVTILNPGSTGSEYVPPSATIGIGPSGFLLEDAGSPLGTSSSTELPYANVLGAGYGAIGLSKPSSPLTTSTVVAAQYQGILYGAASGSSGSSTGAGFRLIGSFGYPNSQTPSCAGFPAALTSSTSILYGGEFDKNDSSANLFGNCDLAIDLGNQDPNNNGLYPGATVYVSTFFSNNDQQNSAYSFSAVAVAGQIDGKYAIFLIGVENSLTTGSPIQPWGIYLLQSN